eukprot:CAMPEP_0185002348 /NCGR_PEP_ID=MMETSP1098-20130426/73679_1 /TAXON_ID=89044 /ORGANISM="Spumella elongata, Strain CCAP 955/1" /LENGTH=254 /DNA_ID=CAMNT_0027529831 /DNA_START=36 /DNA_END=797 /DNA_ORIENTATION=+
MSSSPVTKICWIDRQVAVTDPAGSSKTWKRNYFALRNGVIQYFEDEGDKLVPPYGINLLGEMALRNCVIKDPADHASMEVLIVNEADNDKNILLQFERTKREKEWRDALAQHCDFANTIHSPTSAKPAAVDNSGDENGDPLDTLLDAVDTVKGLPPVPAVVTDVIDLASTAADALAGAGGQMRDAVKGAIKLKHVALAGVKLVTTLGSKVPVVGKFFVLVDDLLILLDNFRCNKKEGQKLLVYVNGVVTLLMLE